MRIRKFSNGGYAIDAVELDGKRYSARFNNKRNLLDATVIDAIREYPVQFGSLIWNKLQMIGRKITNKEVPALAYAESTKLLDTILEYSRAGNGNIFRGNNPRRDRNKVAPSKIDQLKSMRVVGNAHDDRDIFNLAHEIAADELESMENRIEALRAIDRAMGEEDPSLNDPELAKQALYNYLRDTMENTENVLDSILEARRAKPAKDLSQVGGENSTTRLAASSEDVKRFYEAGDKDGLVQYLASVIPGSGISPENVKKFFMTIGYALINGVPKEVKNVDLNKIVSYVYNYILKGSGLGVMGAHESREHLAEFVTEDCSIPKNLVESKSWEASVEAQRRSIVEHLAGSYTRYQFPNGGIATHELIQNKGLTPGVHFNWVRDNVLDLAYEVDDFDIQEAIHHDRGEEI